MAEEIEYQKKWKYSNTLIDKNYIESNKYRRKFDKLTNDSQFARLLYQCAKKMLYHRSGSSFEDMCWFDLITKKEFAKITYDDEEYSITYDNATLNKIKKHDLILTMHTHPNSFPPSIADFHCNFKYNYTQGIIICHNGQIYKYQANVEVKDTNILGLYDRTYRKSIHCFNDEKRAQLDALLALETLNYINFEEVK